MKTKFTCLIAILISFSVVADPPEEGENSMAVGPRNPLFKEINQKLLSSDWNLISKDQKKKVDVNIQFKGCIKDQVCKIVINDNHEFQPQFQAGWKEFLNGYYWNEKKVKVECDKWRNKTESWEDYAHCTVFVLER